MGKSEKAYVKFCNHPVDQVAEGVSFLSTCMSTLRDNLVLLSKEDK